MIIAVQDSRASQIQDFLRGRAIFLWRVASASHTHRSVHPAS